MTSFLKRYREAMEHKHGWDVELECNGCGKRGIPEYRGWKPSQSVRFGAKPTIYADVACAGCGRGLKEEAGSVLVRLFSDLTVPPRNKRIIIGFIAVMAGIPLILAAVILYGISSGWWTYSAFLAFAGLPVLYMPAIFTMNYRIAAIRRECACGAPDYVFMGMLGRSYCYRCSSCGRQLRLRD
jgi:hypothetical protein